MVGAFFVFVGCVSSVGLFGSGGSFITRVSVAKSLNHVCRCPRQVRKYLFLLYLQNRYSVAVRLSRRGVRGGSVIAVLPRAFMRIRQRDPSYHLCLVKFGGRLLGKVGLFGSAVGCLSTLVSAPVVPLHPRVARLFRSCFLLLVGVGHVKTGPGGSLVDAVLLAVLRNMNDVRRGAGMAAHAFGHKRRVIGHLIRCVVGRCAGRQDMTFCTSLLRVSPRRLDAAVGGVAKGAIASVVTGLIVASTRTGLGSASLAVRRVTCSLGFPSVSFFKGCFGECAKVSPGRCERGK